ncbi:LOW QUALITY PROTEIN: hypothetical protein HZS_5690 [Henneguya salminicola]|nr:LOW QUALITY PROTEIN: hypothetical protein HZS_5690 [Henneguya salminicola]
MIEKIKNKNEKKLFIGIFTFSNLDTYIFDMTFTKFNESLEKFIINEEGKKIFLHIQKCIVRKIDKKSKMKYFDLGQVFSNKRKHESAITKPQKYRCTLWETKYADRHFNNLFLNQEIIEFLNQTIPKIEDNKLRHILILSHSGRGISSIIKLYCQLYQIKLIPYNSLCTPLIDDLSRVIAKPDQKLMQQHTFTKTKPELLSKSIEYLTECLIFDDVFLPIVYF